MEEKKEEMNKEIEQKENKSKKKYIIPLSGIVLAYSRERHAFREGYRKRGQHQQQIIDALIKKITNSKIILSNYSVFLSNLSSSFQTNISDSRLRYYIKNQLEDMKDWKIVSISLDSKGTNNYTYNMPGCLLYVMEPDYNTVNKASKVINGMISGKAIEELDVE